MEFVQDIQLRSHITKQDMLGYGSVRCANVISRLGTRFVPVVIVDYIS